MAHFYGTLRGSRGKASRLGTKTSGLDVCAASWAGAIRVHIWHDTSNDVDRFEVRQEAHHGAGVSEPIATGVLGQPAKRQAAE
ncbi:hypothetical protein LCGC14_2540870 [marine sediment metagenome]|uniref:Uncharacterized protein n=1 Tax=marine sediment metagenome TaxID=412755 RepID=A0A0F9D299_9ZZZZ